MFGLRGDDESRAGWLELAGGLLADAQALRDSTCYETFDALLLLHCGQFEKALNRLSTPPEQILNWRDGLWRSWHAALWAEAGVLSGHADAGERVHRARAATAGNPIAAAIVDRAAALATGDRARLLDAAAKFAGLGCRYQWARALDFAGGAERLEARRALADMGAAPMRQPQRQHRLV